MTPAPALDLTTSLRGDFAGVLTHWNKTCGRSRHIQKGGCLLGLLGHGGPYWTTQRQPQQKLIQNAPMVVLGTI